MSTHHARQIEARAAIVDKWLTDKLAEGEQRKAAMREEAARIARMGPVERPVPRSDVQADYDEARESDWWTEVDTRGRDYSVKED
jgi:hypothetical protein